MHLLSYHSTKLHFLLSHQDKQFSLIHFVCHLTNYPKIFDHHSKNIYHIHSFYQINILLHIFFHLAIYKSLIHASYFTSNCHHKFSHHNVYIFLSLLFFLETIIRHIQIHRPIYKYHVPILIHF